MPAGVQAALKAARLECGIEEEAHGSLRWRHAYANAPAGAGNGPAPQFQSLLGHSHSTPQPATPTSQGGRDTPAIRIEKRC